MSDIPNRFTIIDDRPVAISGLENRLLRTFDTDGGYGILEYYLHRSLLWKRLEKTLVRIDSPRCQRIPSRLGLGLVPSTVPSSATTPIRLIWCRTSKSLELIIQILC